MSTAYFIGPISPGASQADESSPATPRAFQLDPQDYARKTRSRWPHSKQGQGADQFTWWLDEPYARGIEVMLHDDWQHVSIRGRDVNFVDFILWHRSLIDAAYPLYAYNISNMQELALQADTTRQQIVAFFHVPDIDPQSRLNGTWIGQLDDPSSRGRGPIAFRCSMK